MSTYLGRCLHANCWCARCVICGKRVTAHDFTREDAQAALEAHVDSLHPLPVEEIA